MAFLLWTSLLLPFAQAAAPEGFGPYRFGMSAESSLRAKNCSAFSMVLAPAGDVVPADEIESICPWTGVLPSPVEVRLRFRGGRLKETYVVVAMSAAARQSLLGTFTGMPVVETVPKDVWRHRPAQRTMYRLDAFPKRAESAKKLLQPEKVTFEQVRAALVARIGVPTETVEATALAALNRKAGTRLVERWTHDGKLSAFVTYVNEDDLKQAEISLLGQE